MIQGKNNLKVNRVSKMSLFQENLPKNTNKVFFGQVNVMNEFSGDFKTLNPKKMSF